MKLENKTVFITGASKRIGREIALYFAKMGANVCIHFNTSKAEAISLKAEILQIGSKAEIYQANLEDVNQAISIFKKAINDFQKIDFLINNASIFKKNSIFNITQTEFERDFAIQTKTPLFLMQEFAKQNFENSEGFILNMLDKNISRKNTSFVSYLLSKKSLHELTQIAAFELAPSIRVNSISPGFIIEEEGITDAFYTENKLKSIPLKRKGSVADILHALDFLLNAKYVTGENITVDGGSFLQN